jgi:large conductance mechanosensitive channel
MLSGFKQFVLRGNVVDMAVGVVIGMAFATVVSAFTKDLLTPLIAALVGKPDFSAISFTVNGTVFALGDFINALISFLPVAVAVYFFVITPINACFADAQSTDLGRPYYEEMLPLLRHDSNHGHRRSVWHRQRRYTYAQRVDGQVRRQRLSRRFFRANFRVNRPLSLCVQSIMQFVKDLDSEAIERLRKQGGFLLTIYHAEIAKGPTSRATESSRSNVIAMQHTVRQMYGEAVARDVADLNTAALGC